MTSDEPHLPPELEEALLRDGYFARLGATRVELLQASNRPSSSVYQVRVEFASGRGMFWIKRHSEASFGDAEREYRFHRDLQDVFSGSERLGALNAVAYLPEVAALVTENVEGVQLAVLIRRSLNRLAAPFANRSIIEGHLERCGEWLAMLHSLALPAPEGSEPESVKDYVEVRLERLVEEGAIDSEFRSRISTFLEAALVELESADRTSVWTHGDYAPYNVIVSDNRLVAIDPDIGGYFGRLGNRCSRYEDLAHFLSFTRTMSSQLIGAGVREHLTRAFLRGYTEAGGAPVPEASAGFCAYRLKYELLGAIGASWPTLLGRLTSRRRRLERFRRWFEQACGR